MLYGHIHSLKLNIQNTELQGLIFKGSYISIKESNNT